MPTSLDAKYAPGRSARAHNELTTRCLNPAETCQMSDTCHKMTVSV